MCAQASLLGSVWLRKGITFSLLPPPTSWPSLLSFLYLDTYPVSNDISQFGVWMRKSGKYNNSLVTSLVPVSSSLIASCAKCLQQECVKHSNSTIIVSGNTGPERILFIGPLRKLNQIKPCFICRGRRLFLIVPANSLLASIRNSSEVQILNGSRIKFI